MVQFEQFNILVSDSQKSAWWRKVGEFHGVQFSSSREIPNHTERDWAKSIYTKSSRAYEFEFKLLLSLLFLVWNNMTTEGNYKVFFYLNEKLLSWSSKHAEMAQIE